MKTCQYAGDPFETTRSHPWTDSVGDTSSRYYDLVKQPELIREVLEDFEPWSNSQAVQSFYELLEFLNATSSSLETNDCAFSPPEAATMPIADRQCEGRVMLLFRDLAMNLSEPRVDALRTNLHLALEALDPSFELGMIGTTLVPIRFLELEGRGGPSVGQQLMISFWAWGNSDAEAMRSLERLFRNLHQALSDTAEPVGDCL